MVIFRLFVFKYGGFFKFCYQTRLHIIIYPIPMQALVTRMMFLQRLLYILKTRRPQAVTVVQILDILTRIAGHSAAMAYEVQFLAETK